MASKYDSLVKSFYLAYYGRPADAEGLAFWSRQLDRARGDVSVIADAFASSDEARTVFKSDDPATRITDIYQQLFGRAPEQAGLDFWLNAIRKGHATIDDVALKIIQGAQGADKTLSTLRQQAADGFNAVLAASGGGYDGAAATDVGRALIQAVGPNASPADIAAMTKSAALLADIASNTPAVIEALGIGADLSGLFSTARGKAEPVALMQALVDLAKAAAGNPATLDALLHGGGMAKVLEVMPSGTGMHELAGALAGGGLPAAIALVYPPAPEPVPPVAGTLHFIDLDGGSGAELPFTNNAMPMLELSGNDAGTTVAYQMSRNGTDWFNPQDAGAQPDGAYYYRAIVTDADGIMSTSNVIGAILDRTAPVPTAVSLGQTDHQLALGETLTLRITFSEAVDIDPSAAPVLFLNDGGSALYQGGAGTDTLVFAYTPAAGQHTDALALAATGALQGKVIDRAGNTVPAAAVDSLAQQALAPQPVVVDTEAPQPTLTVHTIEQRDGASPEAVPATPLATNLASTTLHATLSAPLVDGEYVEYSLDGGRNWEAAHAAVDRLQVTVSGIATAAGPTVALRVTDAAGNHGAVASQTIVYDAEAPLLGTVALASVSHDAADGAPGDALTNVALADVQLGFGGTLAAGERLQYSTDGTAWTDVGTDAGGQAATIRGLDLASGAPAAGGRLETTVFLRAVDSAGNAGTPAATTLVYDKHADAPTVALVNDTGSLDGDRVTSAAALSVTGLETDAKVEYSRDGLIGWSGSMPELIQGMNVFHVRQVDAAGNASDATPFAFQYDSFAPNTPSVALLDDTGSSGQDRVTGNGTVRIGNLEHDNGTVWEYNIDGAGWQPGTPVDGAGYATLVLSGDGPRAVRVRQTDLAGHASEEGTLSFTLDTTRPANVYFDHVEGTEIGAPNVTGLSSADLVFSFDGALSDTDKVQYRIGDGGWIDVDGSTGTIDADARTITLHDIGLANADPLVSVHILDQAGNQSSATQKIDGPYQDLQYTVTATAGGLQVTSNAPANAWVGDNPAALNSTLGGGVVAGSATFGVQGTPHQGTLSVGADQGSALAEPGGIKYALGTNASETLSGQYVWGFGGNDILIGTDAVDYLYGGPDGSSTINGGPGGDVITVQGTKNVLVYENAAQSHVVGGSGPATGFDTVYTPDLGLRPDYYKLIVNTPIGLVGYTDIMNITPAGDSGDSLLAAFRSALPQHFVNTAMLFRVSDQEHYLVVSNADAFLDANDYVIKVVGRVGDFGADFDHNTAVVGIPY